MLKKIISSLLFFACSSLLYGDFFQEDIETLVNEVLQEFHVPGIAVGVISDGEVILANGYGKRDLYEKQDVTEETVFPIASCTKAFTTFLLAKLVEEGHIAWDDLVIQYVPEFKLLDEEISSQITIRDLVAHRTGVPRHDAIWFCQSLTKADLLPCLQHLEPVCPLRTKWYYNNLMYSLAGLVIEKVLGVSWEEAVSERIFLPLKMDHSSTSVSDLLKGLDFSSPHAEVEGCLRTIPFHPLEIAAPGGGINSNVVDMLKWVQLHLDQGVSEETQFVDKDLLQEMYSLQISFGTNKRDDLGIIQNGYGLGWFCGCYKDSYPVACHGGNIDGFISEVLLMPEKKIGIVILSNSSTDGLFAVGVIRNAILDRLLRLECTDWMACIRAKRKHVKDYISTQESVEHKLPSRPLSDFAGTYRHPAYGELKIELKNGKLISFFGNLISPLGYSHGTTFSVRSDPLLIFGIKHVMTYDFQAHFAGKASSVHVSLEPEVKYIEFKRI